jgi:hypothetical protein
VRSFQARSRPGTSIPVRVETAASIGNPLSARPASLHARWNPGASNLLASPSPTTRTRVAATLASPNSTILVPGLPLASPASTRRRIAPPEHSSMRVAAAPSTRFSYTPTTRQGVAADSGASPKVLNFRVIAGIPAVFVS